MAVVKKHHLKDELCLTRARYREGRQLKAVKVYTINQESQYLLVQGVPALGTKDDLLRTFSKHGKIVEHRILDEYPAEEFTEVYLIKYERIQSARVAKRKLDDTSFYGGVLHVCYAPEYETVQETRSKLQERRWAVSRRLKQLEVERQKHNTTTTTTTSSEIQQQDKSNDTEQTSSEQHMKGHVKDNSQYAFNETSDRVQGYDISTPNIHQWLVQPLPGPPGGQFTQYHMNGYPPVTQPYRNQYLHPPPPLPPPPRNMFPWQRLPTQQRFDHARVPSAHATLPPWIEQELSPWQQQRNSIMQFTADTTEQNEQHSDSSGESKQKQSTAGDQIEKQNDEKTTVIKQYKVKGAPPRFVPHQVTKKVSAISKDDFRQNIKDAVNESLRRNAFILDEVKGPHLPPKEEQKRKDFKSSNVGDKSLETTVTSIRAKVKRFSVSLIPRQVKKQKLS